VDEAAKILLWCKDPGVNLFQQREMSHKLLWQGSYDIGEVGDRGEDLDRLVGVGGAIEAGERSTRAKGVRG
jgi:hypothetical protein